MQIQLNTDNHIQGRERLAAYVESELTEALGRFEPQITRLEVHLNDVNGPKSGSDDKRCLIEARLAGMKPIAVTQFGENLGDALQGAVRKLKTSLDRTLGRLSDAKTRTAFGGSAAS